MFEAVVVFDPNVGFVIVNEQLVVDSAQLNEIVVPTLIALKLVGAATTVAEHIVNELDAPETID